MASNLADLATLLASGNAPANGAAEFIRLLQEEQSVRALECLLPIAYDDFGGLILRRIAELLPDEDFQLYISLALWNHHHGCDEEAFRALDRARALAPFDQETLRCDLWLAITNGQEDAPQKCRTLLQIYPHDEWGRQISDLISKDPEPQTLESPRWNNRWEDLITGRRVVGSPQ